jgi:hypothetical protein
MKKHINMSKHKISRKDNINNIINSIIMYLYTKKLKNEEYLYIFKTLGKIDNYSDIINTFSDIYYSENELSKLNKLSSTKFKEDK